MEKKEYEIYIAQQISALNSKYKMEVAKHWHDKLLESLDDDMQRSLVSSLMGTLDKPKPINLSNPEKLARDYALLSGDSIKIVYMGQTETSYVYTYRVRTKPNIAGEMLIMKEKLDGRVCVEFEHQFGGSESRVYEMDEFSDFQKFMELIVNVIRKF